MDMSKLSSYNCLDFETANEQPCSVCSVGVVIVRNDIIVDSFYSLIHPEPEYYQWFCRRVHGLGPEDTEDAPVFPEVWKKIHPLLEDYPLVAHNASFDIGVLRKCLRDYGIVWKPRVRGLCTVTMGRRVVPGISHSLDSLCDYYGIRLNHHHADSDSRACAEILLRYQQEGANPEDFVRLYNLI